MASGELPRQFDPLVFVASISPSTPPIDYTSWNTTDLLTAIAATKGRIQSLKNLRTLDRFRRDNADLVEVVRLSYGNDDFAEERGKSERQWELVYAAERDRRDRERFRRTGRRAGRRERMASTSKTGKGAVSKTGKRTRIVLKCAKKDI